ncbi:MAG: TonB-dependent receptor [Acidobacteriota bacterium]
MNKKTLILTTLIFLLLFQFHLSAQNGKISGYVQDIHGVGIPGVLISVNGTNFNAITDESGHYSLNVTSTGKIMVLAVIEGFKVEIKTIIIKTGDKVNVGFTLKKEELKYEIIVTQKPPELMKSSENIGVVSIKPAQISKMPSLGENDIFRSMQLMPGISASNESSSGLFVRGGKPDENLILYDGMTIYHVDHFFGVFSAFNSNAIEEVELFKGGFGSKYGGRISSVMELTGKSGNEESIKFGGGINFLSFNGFAEIPLGDKGSIFVAGRRSFQSPLYNSIFKKYNDNSATLQNPNNPGGSSGRFGAMFDYEPESFFYDLNAKALFKPSEKDILYLSFYNGMDDLDNSRDIEITSFMAERAAERGFNIDVQGAYVDFTKWGNTGLSLNWQRQWNDRFSSNMIFAYSNYFNDKEMNSSMKIKRSSDNEETESDEEDTIRNIERISNEENKLKDLTFKFGNIWDIGINNQLEFGFQITGNSIDYNYSATNFRAPDESDDSENNIEPINILDINNAGDQYSLYIQDKFKLFNLLNFTAGIRATKYTLTDETFLEPRLSLIIDVSEKIKIKGAWGKYHQFANNIVREDIMQGDKNFWVMSDGVTIPISYAAHLIVGISYETENYLFDIEAYHKDLEDLSEFSLRIAPTDEGIDYDQFFYKGTGIVDGVEMLLQKKFGKFTGWLCYTLGRVEYLFPEFGDDPFPASHDVTHEFKLAGNFKYKKWTFSGTWIYASGKPYTEPVSGYQEVIHHEESDRDIVTNIIEYGPKNGARLPAYHRLDLSATFDFKIKNFNFSTGLSVFNVYNHKNIWRKEFDIAEDELISTDITYLGITPSLFLKIRF